MDRKSGSAFVSIIISQIGNVVCAVYLADWYAKLFEESFELVGFLMDCGRLEWLQNAKLFLGWNPLPMNPATFVYLPIVIAPNSCLPGEKGVVCGNFAKTRSGFCRFRKGQVLIPHQLTYFFERILFRDATKD
jgi:hypothetical protein